MPWFVSTRFWNRGGRFCSKQPLSLLLVITLATAATADDLFIRANQIGYSPAAPKIAVAFGAAELEQRFTVVVADSDKSVFAGSSRATAAGWGRWSNHVELDFSKLRRPGVYQLALGEARSLPFRIDGKCERELSDELLDFMRQQRCGYNPWLDAVCHPFDGRTAYGPMTNGSYINASGGWHDAADLLKYLLTSGNATAQMLLAFELSGEKKASKKESRWDDRVNPSGQPGPNGIADVLDEARWGLEWMLKLHPTSDQLYHQVADDRDHIGRRLPQDEVADYGWGKGSYRVVYAADGKPQGLQRYKSESTGLANLAGRYAAAMGLAYQVWRETDNVFARRCLQAGTEIYEMGRHKEGVQQGNSYKAPYRYEETTWADDMEWGAAELYRATKENRYLKEAVRYAELAADESWMGKEQTGHYQYYPFMNLGHYRLYPFASPQVKTKLAGYYRVGIERCVMAGRKNPYHIGVPFIWCSNNLLTALATQCVLYQQMSGDKSFVDFGQKQIDWLLGRNPWGYCMFTGVGSTFPKDTHLMTVQLTRRQVRGGLVDGPVYERIFKSLKGVTITEPDPLAQFQGPAVYHDDVQDYSTDEPTMDGTASAILLFSLL
jgi:endoglucanase